MNVLRRFAGQANVLSIPRAFIDYMGSLDGALFLSQLLYWSDRAGPDGYFYKSYSEWRHETTLGEYEVRKIAKLLKGKGLLTTRLQKINGSPTLHYKLHIDRFSESILEFLQGMSGETQEWNLEKLKEPSISSHRLHTENTTTKNMSGRPDVLAVFDFWKEIFRKPKAQLDTKRRKAITARLSQYSVDDLKQAVLGCKNSAFHQGANDRNLFYNDIELICRDAKHVDQFIALAEGKGNGRSNEKPRDNRGAASNANTIAKPERTFDFSGEE